jgi:hypothetical protein
MSTATLMTVEQFEQLPGRPGVRTNYATES